MLSIDELIDDAVLEYVRNNTNTPIDGKGYRAMVIELRQIVHDAQYKAIDEWRKSHGLASLTPV